VLNLYAKSDESKTSRSLSDKEENISDCKKDIEEGIVVDHVESKSYKPCSDVKVSSNEASIENE